MGYILNVLIALDQLFNALLCGYPDETISSRLARHLPNCIGCKWLCRLLSQVDPEHCIKAAASEKQHVQLPEELR